MRWEGLEGDVFQGRDVVVANIERVSRRVCRWGVKRKVCD